MVSVRLGVCGWLRTGACTAWQQECGVVFVDTRQLDISGGFIVSECTGAATCVDQDVCVQDINAVRAGGRWRGGPSGCRYGGAVQVRAAAEIDDFSTAVGDGGCLIKAAIGGFVFVSGDARSCINL